MATLNEIIVKKIKFYWDEKGQRWCCRFKRCSAFGEGYHDHDSALIDAKAHVLNHHARKKK